MWPNYWKSQTHLVTIFLRPIAWLLEKIRFIQVFLYKINILKTQRLPIPVIVVGNIVAGGAGKTPIVITLLNRLISQGYRPGVISRGYGRVNKDCCLVSNSSTAEQVGDEPLLIARRCQVPVAVASQRPLAAKALLAAHPECDVIISDDGLQHLALARDMEIVVFDERGLGNELLLPAGPLREHWPRKPRCATHIVLNQVQRSLALIGLDGKGNHHPLSSLKSRSLCAIAGIAKPEAFFQMLGELELTLAATYSYPDHANFALENLAPRLNADSQMLWLCTEKDAVKLWESYPNHCAQIIAIRLNVHLDSTFLSVFDSTLQVLSQSSLAQKPDFQSQGPTLETTPTSARHTLR